MKEPHLFLKGLFEGRLPKHLLREDGLALELSPRAATSLQVSGREASQSSVISSPPASPYEPLS